MIATSRSHGSTCACRASATPNAGQAVSTVSLAADRRDRHADPVYVDLILWQAQAQAAAQHLSKGQNVTFSGRLQPRCYTTSDDQRRVALEVVRAEIEYGPKAHARHSEDDDIAF